MILLSVGAIYSLIPVFVVLGLIAAAASLSRGTNILELFGVGTLMGMPSGARRGGTNAGGGARAAGRINLLYTTQAAFLAKKKSIDLKNKIINKIIKKREEPYRYAAMRAFINGMPKSERVKLATSGPAILNKAEVWLALRGARAAARGAKAEEAFQRKQFRVWAPLRVPFSSAASIRRIRVPLIRVPVRMIPSKMGDYIMAERFSAYAKKNPGAMRQVEAIMMNMIRRDRIEAAKIESFRQSQLTDALNEYKAAKRRDEGVYEARLQLEKAIEASEYMANVWKPAPGENAFEHYKRQWDEVSHAYDEWTTNAMDMHFNLRRYLPKEVIERLGETDYITQWNQNRWGSDPEALDKAKKMWSERRQTEREEEEKRTWRAAVETQIRKRVRRYARRFRMGENWRFGGQRRSYYSD